MTHKLIYNIPFKTIIDIRKSTPEIVSYRRNTFNSTINDLVFNKPFNNIVEKERLSTPQEDKLQKKTHKLIYKKPFNNVVEKKRLSTPELLNPGYYKKSLKPKLKPRPKPKQKTKRKPYKKIVI
jgi:hypothetical protein